jgi:subtilase family serine protease
VLPHDTGALRRRRWTARQAGIGDARCHAHVVLDGAGQPLATSTYQNGYQPSDLWSPYALPGASTASTALIAIVDAYGYPNAESDLATYRAQFKLPACTTNNGCFRKVNQNGVQGSYPRAETGWSQETALDLDMVSAACPSCRILLVEANSSSLSNLGAAVTTAKNSGAHAISNSYGGGESGTSSYEHYWTYTGGAVTVSSGDNGYGVEFPASARYVTAVGGTSLVRAGNSWSETAWSGAGSGCSSVYAQQSWQTNLNLSQQQQVCSKRMVADVSAVADPNTGVAVYGPVNAKSSGWMVFGGTSVGAPLIAGVYGANGGSVNYGSDPYTYYNSSYLWDVTSGSNGLAGTSSARRPWATTDRRGLARRTGSRRSDL